MPKPDAAADLLGQLGKPYRARFERFAGRHAELLDAVQEAARARLVAEPCGEARWMVSVCAPDVKGILAVIAGLFAARRVDVRNGDAFTLRPEPPAAAAPARRAGARRPRRPSRRKAPAGRILDVFEVLPGREVEADFWAGLERELGELVALLASDQLAAAVERVALGVSEAIREAEQEAEPLLPLTVAVDNESDPGATELRIQSPDSPAFLFEFANALTLLDVHIERVEIRTLYGEACDTFWVTDARRKKIESPQRIQELRVATALIKQFSHLLPRSANPAQALQQFSLFASEILRRPDWTSTLEPLGSRDVLRALADMMGVSRFLWEDFLRLQHENLFPVLSDVPGLDAAKERKKLEEELALVLADAEGDEAPVALNRFKDREMFRIDLRHVTHRIDLLGFSEELTRLAEAIIVAAGELCTVELSGAAAGRPWCICGAGKLGGRELGFASDIELIFVFDRGSEDVALVAPAFEGFVQRFLKTLTARQNGVFEIDLRLRPYGGKGPLACSLDAFNAYYAPDAHAHQFERMALVKLRPIAGDPTLGQRIRESRDAFVYSGEPLDLANVRHLRERQAEEIAGGRRNAKFSPGGLVDVEYFVQARQIEAGDEHAEVRATNTLASLERLAEIGAVERGLADRVAETYAFLRRLIDALRVVRGNAKDLAIPDPASREFDYLARRLGYGSPESLAADVERHAELASSLWAQEG